MYKRWTDPINVFNSKKDSRELMIHQKEAVDSMNKYYDVESNNKKEQNGLLVMPTGSGKTFTAVNWLLNSGVKNGYKIIWLVHRQDLITQTYKEFSIQSPALSDSKIKKLSIIPVSGVHYGMSQASKYHINICSINSIANSNGFRFINRMLGTEGKNKVVVVIDEAHHAVSPSYQKVIKRITELNPSRILLGLTATPIRMQDRDQKKLMDIFNVTINRKKGLGSKKGYVYEETLKNLIINGSLAKPIYKRIDTNILGDVEYIISDEDEKFFNKFNELSENVRSKIASSKIRNEAIVNEYIENEDRYGKTLIFAVNQEHCRQLYKEFTDAGVSCHYVISDEPKSKLRINQFKYENKFKVLINVQILTEGYDVPDIQSIFLTRQTNSDSLLMQMIGRGLRGLKYGGTKEAYIVDFHDKWEKFVFWLDPQILDIFITNKTPILSGKLKNGTLIDTTPDLDLFDLYSQIYNKIRSKVISETSDSLFPDGWYSVLDEDGNDSKILVFDNQLDGYERLSKNIDRYLERKYDATKIISEYFDIQNNLPKREEVTLILHMIFENKEMPLYYTFEQRDLIDPKMICEQMKSDVGNVAHEEEWLEELYYKYPILQELYKYFYVFRKTVFNSINEKFDADLKIIDEREEFNIIENFYDLNELLDEVINEYDFMNRNDLIGIRWSNKINKTWFGLCQRYTDENNHHTYNILINRVLSSPNIPRDVLKFLIYHEMLHKSEYWPHDERFREQERRYHNCEDKEGYLDELSIRYDMDTIFKNRKKYTTNNEEQEKKYKFCRNCGNKLPAEANFCDNCGEDTRY